MANRYWVGGSGQWDSSGVLHWSATSGGAGGATAPTSSDAVFFDQVGTYTVTCTTGAVCQSFNASAGTVSFTGGSISVYNGNFTLSGSLTVGFSTPIYFRSNAAFTFSLTSGGRSLGVVYIDNAGSGIAMADALTCSRLILVSGSFSTSTYNLTLSGSPALSTTGTSNKTLSLNNSTVTMSYVGGPITTSIDFGGTTGTDPYLTLNAGISTINGVATGTATFYGGGKTFYNYNFRSGGSYTYPAEIYGANTFNNLQIYGGSYGAVYDLYANQTINGTLSTAGGAGYGANTIIRTAPSITRLLGSNVTITAAAKSLSYCSFSCITAAGAAAPFSGTNIGDLGNNSNITFTAAKTVYWSLAAGGTWGPYGPYAPCFAATSGGAAASTNSPLPQDTVIIDNAGLTTGNTITFPTNAYYLPNINCTRTNSWIVSGTLYPAGDITFPSVTSGSGTPSFVYYHNTGYKTLTLNGTLSTSGITIDTYLYSGLKLGGSWSNPLTSFVGGTLDLNGYTWTLSTLGISSNLGYKLIVANGGNFTITGNNTTVLSFSASYLACSGNVPFNLTYSGSVGTRYVYGGTTASSGLSTATSTLGLDINVTAGTDTVMFTPPLSGYTFYFGNINFTGFSGTYMTGGTTTLGVTGLTFSSGMTVTSGSTDTLITYDSGTITTNGKTWGGNFRVGAGTLSGTTTLGGALTVSGSLTGSNGTFSTAGYAVSASTVSHYASSTSNITWNFGSSTITVTGSGSTAWSLGTYDSLNAGTSTINLSSASTKGFTGGTKTYYNVANAGAGELQFLDNNNSFNTISTSTVPATISFAGGTSNTVATLSGNGTAGNLLTFTNNTTASQYTINLTNLRTSSYTSYKYMNVSPAGKIYAYLTNGNVDAGNNTGIYFTVPATANMFLMF